MRRVLKIVSIAAQLFALISASADCNSQPNLCNKDEYDQDVTSIVQIGSFVEKRAKLAVAVDLSESWKKRVFDFLHSMDPNGTVASTGSPPADASHGLEMSAVGVLTAFVIAAVLTLRSFNGNIEGRRVYVVIIFWMVMSMFMNLLNKQSTVLLRCPFTLVLIQLCVSIVALSGHSLSLFSVRAQDLWRWMALSVVFAAMLCTSMLAFTQSSVTCYLVVRNCLPLLTLPMEKMILGQDVPTSASMVFSLIAIGMGAAMYARYEPGHGTTQTGLVWIVLNCFCSVLHRVGERYVLTNDMRMSFETMTLINNVMPVVPVAMLAWTLGETEQWPKYQHLLHEPASLAVLACGGLVGLCLGQSSIMVQKCVSATTMMVLQSSAKLLIIALAMIIFKDHFSFLSAIGCASSLLGCAAYGVAQRSAKENSKERAPMEVANKAYGSLK